MPDTMGNIELGKRVPLSLGALVAKELSGTGCLARWPLRSQPAPGLL